jgi:hypothetical protein
MFELNFVPLRQAPPTSGEERRLPPWKTLTLLGPEAATDSWIPRLILLPFAESCNRFLARGGQGGGGQRTTGCPERSGMLV